MRTTIRDLREMKGRGERIPMVTAYDYTSGRILEEAGIPIVLVGDSLAQVVLGYDSTLPVTMDEMIHHVKAVARGTERTHVVADLPFMSYQADVPEALRNAGRMLKEGGAQSVKLEGGRHLAETVRTMVEAGIPVMGHIGLTPQSVNQLGGYRVQGKSTRAAVELMEDARALEEAGAYAIVLELVPTELGELVTKRVSIPTIGIGAGGGCDGQVQVFHDLLGLYTEFVPRHAGRYAALAEVIGQAVATYAADVRGKRFPTEKESYSMSSAVRDELTGQLSNRPQ